MLFDRMSTCTENMFTYTSYIHQLGDETERKYDIVSVSDHTCPISANFSPSSATPDLQAATDRTTPQGTVLNGHEATQGQDSSNMLPIVQAQRERYRQRNQELEEEKAAAQQQMQVAQV